MVLVTDGRTDRQAAIAAAERAKAAGIQVICLGTDDADAQLLATLATSSELSKHVRPDELEAAIGDAAGLLPPARDDDESDSIIKL